MKVFILQNPIIQSEYDEPPSGGEVVFVTTNREIAEERAFQMLIDLNKYLEGWHWWLSYAYEYFRIDRDKVLRHGMTIDEFLRVWLDQKDFTIDAPIWTELEMDVPREVPHV